MVIIQISRGTPKDDELNGSLRCAQETSLLMSDVQSEVPSANYIPSSKKFLVHVLLDFFCHVLLVGTILDCVVDDVLGLELDLGIQFGVGDFDSPLLRPLVHEDQL
jgi:hypothetical protein